jgi:hypothetical protein
LEKKSSAKPASSEVYPIRLKFSARLDGARWLLFEHKIRFLLMNILGIVDLFL